MKGELEVIHCHNAPRINGHYSHAVVSAGVVYVSGQLGRGPTLTDTEAGDIVVQTHRCLEGLRSVLLEAGSDLRYLTKVTAYVSDIALWPDVNTAYAEVLGAHRPARTVVPIGPLHFGALIEMDAIAVVPKSAIQAIPWAKSSEKRP